MRDTDEILWNEMTEGERDAFGRTWVQEYARDLVVECGCSPHHARVIAKLKLDHYLTQTLEARDEAIRERRAAAKPPKADDDDKYGWE